MKILYTMLFFSLTNMVAATSRCVIQHIEYPPDAHVNWHQKDILRALTQAGYSFRPGHHGLRVKLEEGLDCSGDYTNGNWIWVNLYSENGLLLFRNGEIGSGGCESYHAVETYLRNIQYRMPRCQ